MKKFSITLLTTLALFSGCAMNNTPTTPHLNTATHLKILKRYHIDESKLHKFGNGYVFAMLQENGIVGLYKLDKNYNLISRTDLKILLDPAKLKIFNNKIYLLGYAQNKNKPVLITFDKNGIVLNIKYYGSKYNTPRDFIINKKHTIIALQSYQNGVSNIKIIDNGKVHIFRTNHSENIHTIVPFNNGYIIGGDIMDDSDNALLLFVDKNFNVIWKKDLDSGYQDSIDKVKIVKDKIFTQIISQNYTGMIQKWDVTFDKNGNIVTKSKKLYITDVPLRFK